MRYTAILVLLVAMAGCNDATNNDASRAPKSDTLVAGPATAKTETSPAPPQMDSATAAKKMMEYMMPGDMQKMMASWDGKWTAEGDVWMDEKSPAQHFTSTWENKMILGGRYQENIHHGNMMGQPYEGRATTGFDNARKVFESSWVDNFGTGVIYMEGPWDSATKTATLKGTVVDPVRGKMEMRETMKIIDDKHQEVEMYGGVAGGKETKVMAVKLTKK
jgi:hypothetical protein